jgi:hypothetical protein
MLSPCDRLQRPTPTSSNVHDNEVRSELSRNAEPIERLYRTLEAYFFKGQPRAFVGENLREEDHLCRGGDRGWRGRERMFRQLGLYAAYAPARSLVKVQWIRIPPYLQLS